MWPVAAIEVGCPLAGHSDQGWNHPALFHGMRSQRKGLAQFFGGIRAEKWFESIAENLCLTLLKLTPPVKSRERLQIPKPEYTVPRVPR